MQVPKNCITNPHCSLDQTLFSRPHIKEKKWSGQWLAYLDIHKLDDFENARDASQFLQKNTEPVPDL